jgi:hypothetical protein
VTSHHAVRACYLPPPPPSSPPSYPSPTRNPVSPAEEPSIPPLQRNTSHTYIHTYIYPIPPLHPQPSQAQHVHHHAENHTPNKRVAHLPWNTTPHHGAQASQPDPLYITIPVCTVPHNTQPQHSYRVCTAHFSPRPGTSEPRKPRCWGNAGQAVCVCGVEEEEYSSRVWKGRFGLGCGA